MKISKHVASAAVLGAVLLSCQTEPVTGRRQLSLVPEGQMLQMGAQAYQEVLSQSTLVRSGPQFEQVVRVGKNIADVADQPDFQWEFNLIQDDRQANAFALPGGKIAVYTGILPITKTDAGLAVVLAHEVGHAIANHSGERMSHSVVAELGLGVVDQFLTGSTSPGSHRLIMGALGLGTQVGVLLPYSRQQESAADRIGLELMAKAGYPPTEAVAFWQRMEAHAGGAAPPEFLSTHPSHETRIRDLARWAPEVAERYGDAGTSSSRRVDSGRREGPTHR
jgi:predicted Zn-dependent protease